MSKSLQHLMPRVEWPPHLDNWKGRLPHESFIEPREVYVPEIMVMRSAIDPSKVYRTTQRSAKRGRW